MHIFNSVFALHLPCTWNADFYKLRFSIICELWSSKPNWRLSFLMPSIIIMATANEPWNTETKKMDQNLLITTERRHLLTRLKWASISREVRLDDWQQQKRKPLLRFEFQSSHVVVNRNKFALKNKLHHLHVMQWFFITCSCDVTCTWILCHYLSCVITCLVSLLVLSYSFSYCLHKLSINRYKIKLLE